MYKTITRTPTGETPFRLTYGIEVMIPVEVGVTSTKRATFNEEGNDDKLRLNLDWLDEVRDKASSKMEKYQQKMTEYYNKRVKLRQLDIEDLVLRKVTLATKTQPKESLDPHEKGPIESSTTLDEAAITWNQLTGKNSLAHGTLST